uniref:Cytochrome P450 n=1 Tax=Heterorhabditis bacteriophora TaxID=37862 RepID=A0A1I7XFE0_HETBA
MKIVVSIATTGTPFSHFNKMFILIILTCFIAFFFAKLWLKVRYIVNDKVKRKKIALNDSSLCIITGPIPLPILGNAFQIGYALAVHGSFVNAMKKWAEEYGPVFTLWFGPFANVTIADFDIAQEAMVKSGALYADRAGPFLMNCFRGNQPYCLKSSTDGRGIIVSNDQHWIEQRRFALHTLRNFGLGKNVMEQRIMDEFELRCEQVDKELAASEGRLCPHQIVDFLVGNIINRILFSERFEEMKEVEFFKLKKRIDRLMDSGSFIDLIIDDWSKDLPFVKQRFQNFSEPIEAIYEFINKQIEKRKGKRAVLSEFLVIINNPYTNFFIIIEIQ